jgi:hypothetical protein
MTCVTSVCSCKYKSRFCILRFEYHVRVKTLTPRSVRRSRFNLYAYYTLSGSSPGTTSEYPVSKAMGKIARRDFARFAAIVSKMEIQGRTTNRTREPTRHGFPIACLSTCDGASQWRFSCSMTN